MKLASDGHLSVWTQDENAELVGGVHHVKERKPRVGARGRENLKEGLMPVVVRIPSPEPYVNPPRNQGLSFASGLSFGAILG
jgi:hypothetical protein